MVLGIIARVGTRFIPKLKTIFSKSPTTIVAQNSAREGARASASIGQRILTGAGNVVRKVTVPLGLIGGNSLKSKFARVGFGLATAETFAYQFAKSTGQPYAPVSTLGGIASYAVSPLGAFAGRILGTGFDAIGNVKDNIPNPTIPQIPNMPNNVFNLTMPPQDLGAYSVAPQFSSSASYGVSPSVNVGGGTDYSALILALLGGGALGLAIGRKKRKKKKSKKGKRSKR